MKQVYNPIATALSIHTYPKKKVLKLKSLAMPCWSLNNRMAIESVRARMAFTEEKGCHRGATEISCD